MKVFAFWLLGILFLYAQILLGGSLSIAGVIPNLLLGYIIYTSTRLSLNFSVIMAFLFGLAFDLTYPLQLGLGSMTMVLIAALVNLHHPSLNKEKPAYVALGVLAINVLYFFLLSLYHLIAYKYLGFLLLQLPLSIVYNTAVSFAIVSVLAFINRLGIYVRDDHQ